MKLNNPILQETFLGDTTYSWGVMGIIVLTTLLVRRPLSYFLSRTLARVADSFTKVDDYHLFLRLTRRPITQIILMTGLYIGLQQLNKVMEMVLWHKAKAKLLNEHILLADLVDKLFYVSMIYYVTLLLNGIFQFVIHAFMSAKTEAHSGRAQMLPHVESAGKVLLWGIALFTLLGGVFNMNIPALIASLGIGGVALALAAKETVENTLAAFVILVDRPFKTGEIVRMGSVEGTVERIGFRSTRLRTNEQTLMVVPNKNLINDNLENVTERLKLKVQFKLSIPQDTEQAHLQNLMQQMESFVRSDELVLDPVHVGLHSFENYALQLLISYYLPHDMASDEVNEMKEKINLGIFQLVTQSTGFAVPIQKTVE